MAELGAARERKRKAKKKQDGLIRSEFWLSLTEKLQITELLRKWRAENKKG